MKTPTFVQDGRRSPQGSHFIDAAAAELAVERALPSIMEAMKDASVGDSGFFHLVVMDPALTPSHCRFEEAILLERSVGDRERWDADYGAFARAKTRLAWQRGVDSAWVQALRPWQLETGDATLWGSVNLEGIVVGASGLQAWWDEAFCLAIAANLRAIAKARAEAARSRGELFLGRS